MDKIYFAKLNENAKIPNKREEDGAFDIYACFYEDYMMIEPFTSKLIPTGIASAFSNKYVVIFRERGSTGIKNIKINAGVIDSGYRDEWFVLLYNANDIPLFIAKNPNHVKAKYSYGIIYPYEKAIAQFLLIETPKAKIVEKSYEELFKVKSERGLGKLGSSGK